MAESMLASSTRPTATRALKQAKAIGLRLPEETTFVGEFTKHQMVKSLTKLQRLEHGLRTVIDMGTNSNSEFGYTLDTTPTNNNTDRKTIVVRKNAGLLPGIKLLFDKKRRVIKRAMSGELSLAEQQSETLRAIFTKDEIGVMSSFCRDREWVSKNREFFEEALRKATKGSFSKAEMKQLNAVLGATAAAKMTIVYNDRLAAEGKSGLRLEEGTKTRKLRAEITECAKELKELNSLMGFLRELEYGKFPGSREFLKAVRTLGCTAQTWIAGLDWRDMPFVIQYAVGKNERIKNPYHNEFKYCDDYTGRQEDREQISEKLGVKRLEKRIRDARQHLKNIYIYEE